MFQSLAKNFLRGLLFVVPVAATAYVVYFVFVTVDNWINVQVLLNRRIPGAGLMVSLALITLIGFLATNVIGRWLLGMLDRMLAGLPLVKLLYTSLRDLIDAFVGPKRRFDRPVLVALDGASDIGFLGFLTREDLSDFGIADSVAVYFPQSYNFAGNLLIVSRHRVRPVAVDSKTVMTFVVSGGVSGGMEAQASPLPLRSPVP